ncbi:hypothetical protein Y695_02698 [Hydrogenophaga sp. T4]|nr:hypothetical protein Y695_02698 [Hydrogenophaga sp. T4]
MRVGLIVAFLMLRLTLLPLACVLFWVIFLPPFAATALDRWVLTSERR